MFQIGPIDFEINVQNNEPYFHEAIVITGKAADDTLIEIYQGSRVLGSDKVKHDGKWKITIPGEQLGLGSVVLSVVAATSNGDRIYINPLTFNIKPSPGKAAIKEAFIGDSGLLATIQYKNGGNEVQKIDKLDGQYKNLLDKKKELKTIRIDGQFRVNQSGFHQMTIHTKGKILLYIDGQMYQRDAPESEYGLVYIPLFLDKGWHSIFIQPSPEGLEKLSILLSGNQLPVILGRKQVRYSESID